MDVSNDKGADTNICNRQFFSTLERLEYLNSNESEVMRGEWEVKEFENTRDAQKKPIVTLKKRFTRLFRARPPCATSLRIIRLKRDHVYRA